MYKNFFQPRGIENSLHVTIDVAPNVTGSIGLLRKRRSSNYTDDEQDRFGELVPHIKRAILLRRKFLEIDAQRWAAVDALDHLPIGVVIVDGESHVRYINAAAERIADTTGGIEVRHGQIWAEDSIQSVELRGRIRKCIEAMYTNNVHADSAISLRRVQSETSLHVRVCPVWHERDPASIQNLTQPHAVLYVTDPDKPHESAPELLTRLFGLTPGDANFLAAFVRTRTTKAAAQDVNITMNTARGYVKILKEKIGARSQPDLIGRVLVSPAWQRANQSTQSKEFWNRLPF